MLMKLEVTPVCRHGLGLVTCEPCSWYVGHPSNSFLLLMIVHMYFIYLQTMTKMIRCRAVTVTPVKMRWAQTMSQTTQVRS